jgi:hypothetical protein
MLASLPILALAAAGVDGPTRLELAVSAGAAYDTNPAGVSGLPDDVGSPSLLAVASAGVARDLGEAWSLYAGLRLDALDEIAFDDLSRLLAEAEGVVLLAPWRPLALVLSASGGAGFYGDPDRNGPVAGARAVLRVSPAERLALRARLGVTWREAEDPLHSSDGWRTGLGAELRLGSGSYLRGGWSLGRAEEVFYVSSGVATAGATAGLRTGRFGPGGGLSEPVEPVRATAETRIASVGLEIGLGESAYLDLELSRTWSEAEPASYQADSVTAVLGFRR